MIRPRVRYRSPAPAGEVLHTAGALGAISEDAAVQRAATPGRGGWWVGWDFRGISMGFLGGFRGISMGFRDELLEVLVGF